jgi:hypothetical protein
LGETRNLAEKRPELTASLLEALADWEAELAPPKWVEGAKWERNQILKHQIEVTTREMERKYPRSSRRRQTKQSRWTYKQESLKKTFVPFVSLW